MPSKPLPVPDAAAKLGLAESRVRALLAAGLLDGEKIGGRWLVDPLSVAMRHRQEVPAGRPFTEENAWNVVLLASGIPDASASPQLRSRLRRSLRLDGLDGLAPRLRTRCHQQFYFAHKAELRHLRADPLLTRAGVSAARDVGLDLVSASEFDAYVCARNAKSVVRAHGLIEAPVAEANVCLRVTNLDTASFTVGNHAPIAAVALDLAESHDPRSARQGSSLLKQLSVRFRRQGRIRPEWHLDG